MLQPIVILGSGMSPIPSGNLGVIPLDLPLGGILRVAIAHIGEPADHSLRVWVSVGDRAGGVSLPMTGWGSQTVWHPNRTPDEVVYIHALDVTPDPEWRLAIACSSQTLWLNILNLANAENACNVGIIATNI